MKRPWIAAIILATILIVFRVFTAGSNELANFNPIVALLFCGAAFWSSNKWMLPAVFTAWLVSSPLVSHLQGYSAFHLSTLFTLATFAAIVAVGIKFKAKTPFGLIFGSLIAATFFYLTTNTISFISNPVYAKSLDGYIQCMWTGAPLYQSPTWMFFRNSLISNGLATALFLVSMSVPVISRATNFKLSTSTV